VPTHRLVPGVSRGAQPTRRIDERSLAVTLTAPSVPPRSRAAPGIPTGGRRRQKASEAIDKAKEAAVKAGEAAKGHQGSRGHTRKPQRAADAAKDAADKAVGAKTAAPKQ
jgi:hypothetical protein